ncbi:hypothetical protein LCGC14_2341930, partial [marine sediment metagenome]
MKKALTKEEILALMEKASLDPVFFCRTFLAHWFPKPVPWVHRGILAILLRRVDFLLDYGDLDKIIEH